MKSISSEVVIDGFRLGTIDIEDYKPPSIEMMNKRVEEIVRTNKPDINRLEQSQFRNKKDIHQHL